MLLSLYTTRMTSDATEGKLLVGGEMYYTIEQPWRGNIKGHSCVPAGLYQLFPYNSPKHGFTWQLHNPTLNVYGTDPVPAEGRSCCEIHSANWASQLEGCIALGLDDQPMLNPATGHVEAAVESSRNAIEHLIAKLGAMSSGHTLSISRTTMT